MRAAAFSAAAALLPSAAPLSAQRAIVTLDAGGSQVRYADSVQSSAATLTPSLRVEWDRATVGAAGTFAQSAGGWSGQGALELSHFTPLPGPLTLEVSGSTGGSLHHDGTRTGQSLGVARAHLMSDERGAWAGAGAGAAWDGAWRGVRVAEVAAWSHLGPATLLASLSPTQVGEGLRYADAELAARLELPRAEVGASAGYRSGDQLTTLGGGARSWGSATVTAWLTRRIAVVAGAGTYAVDFTQGFPGGRFASLALRVGMRPASRAERGAARSERPAAEPSRAGVRPVGGVLGIRVEAAGAQRALRVHAPDARAVEVMGDFTNWEPVRLTRAGAGWWTVTLPIRPGTHEMNVRTDGGAWIVPPGVPALRDEFGGTTGRLLVP